MSEIDVFVPVHRKDLAFLPLCAQSVRRHLRPRPRRVVAIGTVEPFERRRLRRRGVDAFVGEDEVPGIPPPSGLPVREERRRGWYFQQLAKWQARLLAETPRYAVVDADTVFVATASLVRGDRMVLHTRGRRYPPYVAAYERLLGPMPPRRRSFVAHHMLLDRAVLEDLVAAIEARAAGRAWHEAALDACSATGDAQFSEYETYGTFATERHPRAFAWTKARNATVLRLPAAAVPWLGFAAAARGLRSLSFHERRSAGRGPTGCTPPAAFHRSARP